MTNFVSFSASTLRTAALAALLLGTTSYILPAHAHTAPAQQVAEQGDARDNTSFRVGTAEGDAGEGSFRIGTAEGDAGEGQFRVGTAEGDAGEGQFRVGTAEGDAGEGQFRVGTAEGDAGEGQFRVG